MIEVDLEPPCQRFGTCANFPNQEPWSQLPPGELRRRMHLGKAAVAGLVKMVEEDKIDRNEVVVCLVTGTGLREIEVAAKLLPDPPQIYPNMESLEGALKGPG